MEKTIEWTGYSFMDHNTKKTYSITLSEEKAEDLWRRFREQKGSQQDFYFRFVNPLLLMKEIKSKKERSQEEKCQKSASMN
jgi:REP element-mobilizing transposase RayT